jgi:hypothetical protein
MAFPSIVAGQDVKVYINGVLLGYITGMPQWTIDTEYREAREIDSNDVREWMPGQSRVSGAFQILRGRDTGGLEGAGMVASGKKMLLQKLLTIELVDRLTDETIFRATQCQVTRQTWSTAPKQLVTGTFSWVGTSFENESKS